MKKYIKQDVYIPFKVFNDDYGNDIRCLCVIENVRRCVKKNRGKKLAMQKKYREIKFLPFSLRTYSVVAVAAGSLFCRIETGFSSVNVNPPNPRWSIRLFPTGRSLITGMPIASRWSRGPMPES